VQYCHKAIQQRRRSRLYYVARSDTIHSLVVTMTNAEPHVVVYLVAYRWILGSRKLTAIYRCLFTRNTTQHIDVSLQFETVLGSLTELGNATARTMMAISASSTTMTMMMY
jgi:hypothetical protein